MSEAAHTPLLAEDRDEAERRAPITAVAQARAAPSPDIPHEEVRAEIRRDLEAADILTGRMTPARVHHIPKAPPGPQPRVMQGKAE